MASSGSPSNDTLALHVDHLSSACLGELQRCSTDGLEPSRGGKGNLGEEERC